MTAASTAGSAQASAGVAARLRAAWHWVDSRVDRVPRLALAFAFFGYIAADTPSLLPRPWYFQGLIGGISALIFYGIGVLLDDLWDAFARWAHLQVSVRPQARRTLTAIWYAVLAAGLLVYPFVNLSWHDYVTSYVGQPAPGILYPFASAIVATLVLAVFVAVFRVIAALARSLTKRLERRRVRDGIAKVVAAVLTLVIVAVVMDQVVLRGVFAVAAFQSVRVNNATPAGLSAPTSPLRSGGPGSLVTWQSLGSDGASFVASGPDAADIQAATDAPAKEPIRVFVGMDSSRSLENNRDLAMAELERTGAFDRKAIIVLTSTSTGFVNEWAADSAEYLLHGDVATVTMAYSTLPSAFALLTDRQTPPKASRLLFDAVRAKVQAEPAATRPKLYVGGESLGAYGGNGAYASAQEMMAQVDGALWTGTPSFTPVHAELTAQRAFGSTVVNPVVDGGRHVRFAGNAGQLTADQFGHAYPTWEAPRVAYLQHTTDAVVWWTPDLVFNTPEWLLETRPPDSPMSRMSWLPFVTFWQVTADMAMSNTVPGGFGHRYQDAETVPAWAGVLGLDPAADYSRIEAAVAATPADAAPEGQSSP